MAGRIPSFEEFERKALEIFEAVPAQFRRDVDALVVHEEAASHPRISDFFTLGECADSPLEISEGPLRSTVHLYYGSFRELALRDPSFDVESELVETILHELRHHLEDRAGIPDLLEEDALEEANERRRSGLPFDPRFYLAGEEIEPGVFRVGDDLFLDVPLTRRERARLGRTVSVKFGGERLDVALPDSLDDPVTFVEVPEGWTDDEGAEGDLLVCLRLER